MVDVKVTIPEMADVRPFRLRDYPLSGTFAELYQDCINHEDIRRSRQVLNHSYRFPPGRYLTLRRSGKSPAGWDVRGPGARLADGERTCRQTEAADARGMMVSAEARLRVGIALLFHGLGFVEETMRRTLPLLFPVR